MGNIPRRFESSRVHYYILKKKSSSLVPVFFPVSGLLSAKYGFDVSIFEKMTVLEVEPDNLKQMDTLLTWGQVGIGCQMFLIDFLKILIKIK